MWPSAVRAGDVISASPGPPDSRSEAFVCWSPQSAHSALTTKRTRPHTHLAPPTYLLLPHCSLKILINLHKVLHWLLTPLPLLLVSSGWEGKHRKGKKNKTKQRWLMSRRFVEASRSRSSPSLLSCPWARHFSQWAASCVALGCHDSACEAQSIFKPTSCLTTS